MEFQSICLEISHGFTIKQVKNERQILVTLAQVAQVQREWPRSRNCWWNLGSCYINDVLSAKSTVVVDGKIWVYDACVKLPQCFGIANMFVSYADTNPDILQSVGNFCISRQCSQFSLGIYPSGWIGRVACRLWPPSTSDYTTWLQPLRLCHTSGLQSDIKDLDHLKHWIRVADTSVFADVISRWYICICRCHQSLVHLYLQMSSVADRSVSADVVSRWYICVCRCHQSLMHLYLQMSTIADTSVSADVISRWYICICRCHQKCFVGISVCWATKGGNTEINWTCKSRYEGFTFIYCLLHVSAASGC
jgi:hypothetical protein